MYRTIAKEKPLSHNNKKPAQQCNLDDLSLKSTSVVSYRNQKIQVDRCRQHTTKPNSNWIKAKCVLRHHPLLSLACIVLFIFPPYFFYKRCRFRCYVVTCFVYAITISILLYYMYILLFNVRYDYLQHVNGWKSVR